VNYGNRNNAHDAFLSHLALCLLLYSVSFSRFLFLFLFSFSFSFSSCFFLVSLHAREFLDNKTKYLAELEQETREKENYLDFVSTGRARRKSLARIRSKPMLASPRSEGSDSEMSADELLNSMATLSHTLTPTLTHHNTHNSLQVYLSEEDAALGCHASLTETDCLHK